MASSDDTRRSGTMKGAEAPIPRNDSVPGDKDPRAAYRRRARALWVVALADVVVWYVGTALESLSMGLAPPARRGFTPLDSALIAALTGGTLLEVGGTGEWAGPALIWSPQAFDLPGINGSRDRAEFA